MWVHGKYDREDLVREVSENFQGKTKREGQAEKVSIPPWGSASGRQSLKGISSSTCPLPSAESEPCGESEVLIGREAIWSLDGS